MAKMPKSAIMAERAVVDGKIVEVTANRGCTTFWTWTGTYYQNATGPVRIVHDERELTRDEAIAEVARLEAINIATHGSKDW